LDDYSIERGKQILLKRRQIMSWCIRCGTSHIGSCPFDDNDLGLGAGLPSYLTQTYEPPTYEPPSYDFPTYEPPTYEPPSFDPPLMPPPTPVRDIGNNLIGMRDSMSNQIRPALGGPPLDVGPGGFVRDVVGNMVGTMGPCGTMGPPPSFGF
jgi:hypothetical protein